MQEQESGLDQTPPRPQPPASGNGSQDADSRKPWWHRTHFWVWTLLVVLATIITLEEGYPWLSISKDEALNERNPYQTMFYVTNEGYLPAVDLRSTCTEGMVDSAGNDFNFNTGGTPGQRASEETFADRLNHAEHATIPCYRHIVMKGQWPAFVKARLSINISYYVWPLTCRFCTRHQTLRMEGTPDVSGNLHWTFVN